MARPAEDALNKILAQHPGATVSSRSERGITADLGDGRKTLVTGISAMHYEDNGWQPIDTGWNATGGAWQLEMTTAPYQASARDSFSVGEVLEYRTRAGEWVRFQPLALNWRDENNSQHQIAVPQAVSTQVNDDVLSWPAAYGPGRHFEWRAHPSLLQKLLTVDSASDLPVPTVNGSSIELELTFAFTFDSSVTAFVDGVAWDRSSTVETASKIEFRDAADEVLWGFLEPRAWDSSGQETLGVIRLYRSGSVLHVAVRIPKAFVDSAVFPLHMDPSVSPTVTASGDDVSYNLFNTFFTATNSAVITGQVNTNEFGSQTVFRSVGIPAGATIDTATWDGKVRQVDATGHTVDVWLEDVDSGTAPTTNTEANSKTKTTETVAWTMPVTSVDATISSPDISAVVQEVVDRAGWVSGNDMNVILESRAGVTEYLTFYSFDSGNTPPVLSVTYSTGPTLTLTPNGDGTVSGFEDEAAATTGLFDSVDEGVATADDDTTFVRNAGAAGATAFFDLSSTPADFSSMDSLSIRIRIRKE